MQNPLCKGLLIQHMGKWQMVYDKGKKVQQTDPLAGKTLL